MWNLLTIKILVYKEDTVILSSQANFSWNPFKNHFVHTSISIGNMYSEGITDFPDDSTFISTMIDYWQNGKFEEHKDKNYIIDENVSYKKDEEGNWIESGTWRWS